MTSPIEQAQRDLMGGINGHADAEIAIATLQHVTLAGKQQIAADAVTAKRLPDMQRDDLRNTPPPELRVGRFADHSHIAQHE